MALVIGSIDDHERDILMLTRHTDQTVFWPVYPATTVMFSSGYAAPEKTPKDRAAWLRKSYGVPELARKIRKVLAS